MYHGTLTINVSNIGWYSTLEAKCIDLWDFHLNISIKLVEMFRILSFVFDLKYLSQSKLNQFYNVGGVLESLGQAVFKTDPGFAFWARFEGDIEGLHW